MFVRESVLLLDGWPELWQFSQKDFKAGSDQLQSPRVSVLMLTLREHKKWKIDVRQHCGPSCLQGGVRGVRHERSDPVHGDLRVRPVARKRHVRDAALSAVQVHVRVQTRRQRTRGRGTEIPHDVLLCVGSQKISQTHLVWAGLHTTTFLSLVAPLISGVF